MRSVLLLLLGSCVPLVAHAQPIPAIQWQACYGGSVRDQAEGIQQTSDGGYILTGETESNNGQVTGFHGNSDRWVVRTDVVGNLLWQRALGGTGSETAREIIQTLDGGFVVVGSSNSIDGDLPSEPGPSRPWAVKLDGDGTIQWQYRSQGMPNGGAGWAVKETANGDILFACSSGTIPLNGTCNLGSTDALLVKLDAMGTVHWERCFGGSSIDIFRALDNTEDGGCILVGESWSSDGDVPSNAGQGDFWMVKLDPDGALQWTKSFGGSQTENPRAIKRTSDGGYIVTGVTNSSDGDITGHQGLDDVWVVKVSAMGELLWQRTYGGSNTDSGNDVITYPDGSHLVVGWTNSSDGDVSSNIGQADGWLLRLNADGSLRWQKTFGGSSSEIFQSSYQTNDDAVVLTGYTFSNDGDVSGNHGGGDFWLVKLEAEAVGVSENEFSPVLTIYPNPTSASLIVDLKLPEAELVGFSWYDATGRLLHAEYATRYTAGSQQISLHTDGMLAGPLLLQIRIGEHHIMKRVVKL